ncbi:hypothetical protein TcCL_NonESM04053 [Trypanosoma cruzi]|nr:hypothetical protein TcCL_NonESM04053 [Trypanosoma cruzi]
MQFTAHRMDSQSFTPKKMLHHTSKMSLIRSTAPHGIVLLDAILAAMLPTRRITTFTFTWGKWECSCSSLRRKLDFFFCKIFSFSLGYLFLMIVLVLLMMMMMIPYLGNWEHEDCTCGGVYTPFYF